MHVSFVTAAYTYIRGARHVFPFFSLGKAKIAKTSIILNNLNPEWNESYRIEVCHFANQVLFEIRDKDHAYAEKIGEVVFETTALLSGQQISGWFSIIENGGDSDQGELCLSIQFVPASANDQSYEVTKCVINEIIT